MTSADFLGSLVNRVREQVPFDISGAIDGGAITISNFPAVDESEQWLLQSIFEDIYRYCERYNIPVTAIRLRDGSGQLVSEVKIA